MRFLVQEILFFERPVRFRLPFRFGIVTLTEAPQAFVRARIRLEGGREAWGGAAEMLAPKWFDKDPGLTNEQNFEQLRESLRLARSAYLQPGIKTAYAHWSSNYRSQIEEGRKKGLNALTACFGPALLDRAVLDALCRLAGMSFYQAVKKNLPGIDAPETAGFLEVLRPAHQIAARHTVGLVDPIAGRGGAVNDGLPETLEEVVARYGHRWFKLKVGGDAKADVERLAEIASVLDRLAGPYQASLDGNEQYADAGSVLSLLKRIQADARLKRLYAGIAFVEQPIKRQNALSASVAELAKEKPVIIDESDDTLEAFPRARALGYAGVSSKTCKGLYKSVINAARCRQWNREEGAPRYFMTGEDLTIQAGLALQQDLALVSLLGLTHVERNGHHYVNGMMGLPVGEQLDFLTAHPDLYEKSHGAVRVKIEGGKLAFGSLDAPGYASRAEPDWTAMKEMR